jgi:hypothetical protein
VKFFSSKRRVAAAAALVLLTLFMLRPGGSRLRSRIAGSLSAALGRPVEIGSVHIRLLPRPGFDLENLVVYDDPAFGSEPMLRASELTASVRLTALARGRIEIARLDLTEPSLNLVQNEQGRWNLESLLERSARIPLAPTSKAKSEPRPGFPYIEASSARINFKSGQEKTPYALTSADFYLWQDSENAWGVRLKAQPVRNDLNLNDTGILRVNGSWGRAGSLRETPLDFKVEWDRPQMGQLTKFFTGRDSGWRGTVLLDADITGTPSKLRIVSDASVADFRRYDLTSGDALRLAAHCEGRYSSVDRSFSELLCNAPAGDGRITLKGEMGLPGSRRYSLQIEADEFPAAAVAALMQRAKKNLPADLTAEGAVHGSFSIHEGAGDSSARFSGEGEISDLRLTSAKSKTNLGPETVAFTLRGGNAVARSARTESARRIAAAEKVSASPYIEVEPFTLALGRGVPAKAQGWFDGSRYRFAVAGEADVARTLAIARMVGLAATSISAEGLAHMDLLIAGSWAKEESAGGSGFVAPQVTGTAKLRDMRAAMGVVDGAMQISAADLQLNADGVRVTKLKARAANSLWTGSLELPRGCGNLAACAIHFDLSSDELALGELSNWINPAAKERPWYGVLAARATSSSAFWMNLRAAGRVSAKRLMIRGVEAQRVSANVALDGGKLKLSGVTAEFLRGTYRGEWKVDFSAKPAIYSGEGSFSGIGLAQAGEAMGGTGLVGTAAGSYEIKASAVPGEFWQSAEGSARFDIRDASVPGIALGDNAGTLKLDDFAGVAQLHGGKIEIRDAALESSAGKFEVTGTAAFTRELDFKLTSKAADGTSGGFVIAGRLEDPRVTSATVPLTQAQLKTQATK